jgi:MoaA/NifB/PqqE/SkfB family radical SAM enzyme
MTTTTASLGRVRHIVDAYVENGFREIFLRPISPYGFAVRRGRSRYDTDAWISFYAEGLDYILELNRRGIPITEIYAAIVLKKMLTNDDSGYVDLNSPAGLGIKALLYNYDGDVYASDEGRMLAEMRDTTFRLGNVSTNSYEEIITSPALLDPLEESFSWSVPGCDECAFERYCGADPVFHHAVLGDPVGRKAESPFCSRNMAVFKLLLNHYRSDAGTRELFHRWAAR